MSIIEFGDLRIDNVVEMDVAFTPEWLLYEADRDALLREAEEWGPSLVDPETGQLRLVIQSYLVRAPGMTMLIDTCNGNGRERPSVPFFHRLDTPYWERLTALVDPAEIDLVLCSHLHVDHVGWNVRQEGCGFVPAFPNAAYLFAEAEYAWWRDTHARDAGSPQAKACFHECVEPLVAAGLARLVASDAVLAEGAGWSISLEELPGHTLHQVGVHLRAGGRHVFFTADAAHHAVQFRHPTWRSRPDTDPRLGERTVRDLIARYAGTDTLILTGHSPAPTLCRLLPEEEAARLAFVGT